MRNTLLRARRLPAAVCALVLLVPGLAAAQEACGLCNNEVVTNSDLAGCFLKDYEKYVSAEGPVIVVDLSHCEVSRALAEALPSPVQGADPTPEPDFQFMVSRAQLDCLKRTLEEPGLVLDPSARIDLNACG